MAHALMGPGRPIDPSRAVVGSAVNHGRALEQPNRFRVIVTLERVPSRLPCRACGKRARWIPVVVFGERRRGQRIIVRKDVVRAEVVQRRMRKRRIGLPIDECAHGANVFVGAAQVSQHTETCVSASSRRVPPPLTYDCNA